MPKTPENPALSADGVRKCTKCTKEFGPDQYTYICGGQISKLCRKCKDRMEAILSTELCKTTPFNLKAFKDENMKGTGATLAIFGASKSGKTHMLKHVIENIYEQYDLIVLFSMNSNADIYKDLLEYNNVRLIGGFKPEIVTELYQINKLMPSNEKRMNVMFILDDEIDSKNSSTLRNMVVTMRNMKISTIICSQAYSIIDKKSRGNFNFVMLGRFSSIEARQDLIKIYLMDMDIPNHSTGKKKQVLEKFYRDITEDHKFLVIDNINGLVQNDTAYLYKA